MTKLESVPATPDVPSKRGEAAYKEHTDEVAKRNEAAKVRARAERDERDIQFHARRKAMELREVAELRTIDTHN